MKNRGTRIVFLAVLATLTSTAGQADDATVKVIVPAGQSNMEGKATNALLDDQATDAGTKDVFAHLRKDGKWIVRDDVFIMLLIRRGGPTIACGSPKRTGIELEFGTVMGNHFDEPVLLIKTAWGGHSPYQKFRSPSGDLPGEETLQKELEQAVLSGSTGSEKASVRACWKC